MDSLGIVYRRLVHTLPYGYDNFLFLTCEDFLINNEPARVFLKDVVINKKQTLFKKKMKKSKVRNVLTPEQILRLKEKLRGSGVTYAVLAEKFGITASLLHNYIAGRASMPLWIFEKLQKMSKFDETNDAGKNEKI